MGDELENYIRKHKSNLKREKPSSKILDRILKEMNSKENYQQKGKITFLNFLKLTVAACLLITATTVSIRYFKKRPVKVIVSETSLAGVYSLHDRSNKSSKNNKANITNSKFTNDTLLKKSLVNKNIAKRCVFFSGLNNKESAASRINAIGLISNRKNNVEHNSIVALVQILNNDLNANVRLAALHGLTQFYSQSYVRRELISSLKKQNDPIVQINLIAWLTYMHEPEVQRELKKMVTDERINEDVKDFAYCSLLKLR